MPCPLPHSISWLALSITQVAVPPGPVLPESLSLPPLGMGTSVHPPLVCARLGSPGGRGSATLLSQTGMFALVSIFWSFANLSVLSCGLPFLHIAASDVQLQMLFSKLLLLLLVTSQTLACSRLQPLTYPPCHFPLVGNPDSPKETDLCGGQRRV